MPAVVWDSEDEIAIAAVATPPVAQAVRWVAAALVSLTVTTRSTAVRWTAPGSVLVTASSVALAEVMESRIVTGLPTVFGPDKVRYRRGTYGLMPEAWGVVEDAALDDTATEFEKRDDHGKLFGAGVEGTVYRVALTIRMPVDRAMPEKGEQFYFYVRNTLLRFTVFSGVREIWRVNGLRMITVPARHYTDFPNATPRELDVEINQDLAGTGFLR